MDIIKNTPGNSIFNLKKECINMMDNAQVLRYIVTDELSSEKYAHLEQFIMDIEERLYALINVCDGYLDIVKYQHSVELEL